MMNYAIATIPEMIALIVKACRPPTAFSKSSSCMHFETSRAGSSPTCMICAASLPASLATACTSSFSARTQTALYVYTFASPRRPRRGSPMAWGIKSLRATPVQGLLLWLSLKRVEHGSAPPWSR
eukprot:2673276-Pleurochrysis_carterae.AAC.1